MDLEIDRKRKREVEADADAPVGHIVSVNKRLAVFLDPGSKDEAFWWPAIVCIVIAGQHFKMLPSDCPC